MKHLLAVADEVKVDPLSIPFVGINLLKPLEDKAQTGKQIYLSIPFVGINLLKLPPG